MGTNCLPGIIQRSNIAKMHLRLYVAVIEQILPEAVRYSSASICPPKSDSASLMYRGSVMGSRWMR